MSTTHPRATTRRTRSWGRWPRTAGLAVVALLAAMMAVPSAAFAATPMLASDRTDYSPGDTVTLTGAEWLPGEVIHIVVNDDQSESWRLEGGVGDVAADPVADAAGTFSFAFTLPTWFVAKYTATAIGQVSGTATTTFTDVSIGTYDQCSNDDGDGYASGDTGCRWINGNLQSNNSTYNEHDATVQRLWIEGLSAGTHTVTLQYGTTKGGKHAYDYLTTWNHSESWATSSDLCQGIAGCTLTSADQLGIPKDPRAPYQGDGFFTMWGADLTSATTPTIASGAYSGDSETVITITFMVPTPAPGQGSSVALWFGAHVSSQLDWGTGNGAASISGSPYHVALAALDGAAVGQRDNQMQSGAVQAPASITVVKDAVPNDAQDFGFVLTDGVDSYPFVLDDDTDATTPSTRTFPVRPGTWTVTETTVDGWGLTSIVCAPTQPVSSRSATVTVGSGGSVTCTFTNTKVVRQDLVVTKTAVPSFARDFDWTITKAVDKTRVEMADGSTANFTYTVVATPSAPSDSAWKVTGVITVANPNSIAFTGVDVSDGITGGGVCTYGDPVEDLTVPASGSVEIGYECTYAAQPPASVTNTATATWAAGDYYGTDGTASGTASADFSAVVPSITDGTVEVIDDKTDPAHPVLLGTVSHDGSLVERTFDYTLGLEGVGGTCTDYTNTAAVVSGGTTLDDATQTVTVCVGKDLTVTKTAAASHARLYKWLIGKSVDDDSVTVPAGSSHEFAYGVTVTPNGYTDSTWALRGEITVSNPNDWESVVADVTDLVDMGGGAQCTVTDGEDVTIGASSIATLFYSCTFGSQPNYAGKNVATATWDAAAYFTPTGSASGEADVDVVLGAETNKVIHVTDSMGGALGGWNWADGPKTFSYTVAQAGVAGTCTTYPNTATITETGQQAEESVQLCVAMDLDISKDVRAAFTRTYDWSIDKSVDDTLTEVKPDDTATFTYKVIVTPEGYTDSAHAMSGTITVTNPNDFQDIVATVTDIPAVGGGAECTVTGGVNVTIPKSGEPVALPFSCTFTGAPTDGTNAARAHWSQSAYSTPSGFVASAAAPVTFAMSEVDRTVTVRDDKTVAEAPFPVLGTADFVNGPFQFTYSVDKIGFAEDAGRCVGYTNTAMLDLSTRTDPSTSETVQVCVGADLTVAKTVTASHDRTYQWLIDKEVAKDRINVPSGTNAVFDYTVIAKPNGFTDSGWVMEGTITVTNPNTWQDVSVGLADVTDVGGGATCVVDTANPLARIASTGVTVPANGSVTLPYACTFDSEPEYTGLNTATATWNADAAFTTNGSASTTKDVTFTRDQETNRTVDVYDDKTTDPQSFAKLGTVDYETGRLDIPGQYTFTYSLGATGTAGTCVDFTNTAKLVSGESLLDDDTQTAKVCTGADLTVTKTATASHARLYQWLIDKSADAPASVTVPSGSSHEFGYTVKVTPDGYTDSAWVVSGTITVSNPNDWEAVTADVSDAVDLGGSPTCTVENGADVVVPVSGSVELSYSCTFAEQPAYEGLNTATATWDAAAFFTPTGSASGDADVDVVLDQTAQTNRVITVTDSFNGGTPVVLGTADYYTGPFTFASSASPAGIAGECTDYPNTATITETGQSDSASVELCVAKDLEVAKTVEASYTRTYDWLVEKSAADTLIEVKPNGTATFSYTVTATKDGFVDSGWAMTGRITVTNPNDFQDVVATVTDIPGVGGGAVCTVTDGENITIAAGGQETLGYGCSFTEQPEYTAGTNTARAAYATPPAAPHPFSDTVDSPAVPVTFAMNEVNDTVDVYDDKTVAEPPVLLGSVDWNAGPGPFTFTYTLDKTGVPGTCVDFTNNAFIDLDVGTDPTASEDVTVCVGADLTVAKTVTASYDRTYQWLIDKTAKDPTIETKPGDKAVFDYTVIAKPNGFTDSGWVMSGEITVTNPNTWQDVVADITDVTNVGATCAVTGGTDVTVPKAGSVKVPYSCTFGAKPLYTGSNTATAAWDAAAAFTTNGSASGAQGVSFTLDDETNRTVDVYDDKTSGTPAKIGSADYYGSLESRTFTYPLGLEGVPGTCKSFTNTAYVDLEVGDNPSASEDVSVCTGADLTVSKTATASHARLYKWLIDKSVDDDSVTVPSGSSHEFAYGVTVTPNEYIDSAWVVSGTITVSNPNDWQGITADVTDDLSGMGGDPQCTISGGDDVLIEASDSTVLDYSCTFGSQPNYAGTNTATATWDAAAFFTPTGSASGEADVDVVLGAETDKVVHVTDTMGGVLGEWNWADGAHTFTYEVTQTGIAGECTDYPNTATITETGQSDSASVELCVATDLEVAKTVEASYTRTYDWLVEKSAADTLIEVTPNGTATFSYTVTATKDGFVDSGWAMTGRITVTNPNDFQDVVATVTDIPGVGGGAVCTVTGGTGVAIPANGSVTLGYGCTFESKPAYTSGTNTARAAYATPPAAPHPFSDTVDSAAMPVTFAMDEVNDTVDVYDDKTVTSALPVLLGTVDWNAGPGPFTFSYTLDKTGFPADAGRCVGHTNTAWIDLDVGTDPTASEDVTVCVGADLTVAKTVTASYDRTYQWLIDKVAKGPASTNSTAPTVTLPYSVTVTPNGFTDSGWVMSGEITVTNPNTWQDVVVDITDVTNVGATCAVTGGTDVTVPKAGSVKVPYSCTFGAKPLYTGSNTATAAWDAAAAFTTNGSASGSTDVSFVLNKENRRVIHVVDDRANPSGTPLSLTPPADWSNGPRTYDYSLTFTVPTNGCRSSTNTATITETGQKDTASVQVCGPPLTGARTMGFWQNKNGQTIITRYGSGLWTWLDQYAPLADVNSARNVLTTIKAADASGASMNAMLKGQMLATALDVYFSDPALGGNRLGAPAPIGGLTIDISRWSGGFGGATAMTVSQMLAYASSRYDVTTRFWYGNVKSVQERAKNAFDAINNEKVLTMP